MRLWYWLIARLTGKNHANTPPEMVVAQMNEPRPLPLNRPQWEEWSDRIISGAMLEADKSSMQFSLANMLLHLGPTESHKADAFFIHSLRKFAVNQVADAIRKEIQAEVKTRLAAEEAKKTEPANEAPSGP